MLIWFNRLASLLFSGPLCALFNKESLQKLHRELRILLTDASYELK